MLPFIVGCLEELRAEDAAASRMPNAPAAGSISAHPAEADARRSADAAAAPDSQPAAAQQDGRPSEDATGAAIAPHKQAPFAGASTGSPGRVACMHAARPSFEHLLRGPELARWRVPLMCTPLRGPYLASVGPDRG